MSVLVDSNVLLDIRIPEPTWGVWSSDALARAADAHPLVINPLIYAEVSIGFNRIEDLDSALPPEIRRENLPRDAAFLAGEGVPRLSAPRRRPNTCCDARGGAAGGPCNGFRCRAYLLSCGTIAIPGR